jgi:alkylation response protein AidB-like acyl-CoA dehydrogenase
MTSVSTTVDLDELRAVARTFLTQQWPVSHSRVAAAGDSSLAGGLWQQVVEMGWPAIGVAEDHGGAGADLRELAVIIEEMARQLVPGPFVSSAVVAPVLLRTVPAGPSSTSWLRELAEGRRTFAVALSDERWTNQLEPAVRARAHGNGLQLHGRIGLVADAETVDTLLLPAVSSSGECLVVGVDRLASGVSTTAIAMQDLSRCYAGVEIQGVEAPAAAVLASGADAVIALHAARDTGALAMAADSLGIMGRVIEMTNDYLKARVQFGRPIGMFQALKHRMADLAIAAEESRALLEHAINAHALDATAASLEISMAKAHICTAASAATAESVLMHGGIGYTWEHDLHLYQRRAKLSEVIFGTARSHRRRIADLAFDALA